MDTSLPAHVLATACLDIGLALACGRLAATRWLSCCDTAPGGRAVIAPSMLSLPAAMTAALAAQFLLLAISMSSGDPLLPNLLPVAGMHAGRTLLLAGLASLVLLLASLPALRSRATTPLQLSLVLLILLARSATGHAAGDGDFTVAELLQFLHLCASCLWSGSVILSGLVIIPRLLRSGRTPGARYLQSLSRASTWAVAVVLATGAAKTWLGLDGIPASIYRTTWGRILILKLCLVFIALALGALHRRSIPRLASEVSPNSIASTSHTTFAQTLKLEAICLLLVLLVSAWLSSVDPAGS